MIWSLPARAIGHRRPRIMRLTPFPLEKRRSHGAVPFRGYAVFDLVWILCHELTNEPSGFILTTVLGIAGAFVATYLGQAIGWYQAGQSAGFIGATVGAIIVLVVWGFFAPRRAS